MSSIVIAVDIGTTSTKVLAVTSNGVVVAQHQVFYPTSYPIPGYAEQDANEILAAVIVGLLAIQSQIDLANTSAIVFSSAMHSVVGVNESGAAISPLLIWADTRSSAHAKQLRNSSIGLQVHHQTGTPVHPMSPLCKLMWMRDSDPDLFATAYKFISIKEFVWYHLTGEFCIDYSIASATGLFDIHTCEWSKEALQLAGVTIQRLSKPVRATHRAKINSNKLIAGYQHVPLIIGASDGCLAQLGSNAMQPGTLTITLGTSGAVRRAATRQIYDPSGKLFNYLLTDNYTVAGGATNNGTAVMNWFIKEFTGDEKLPALVTQACSTIPAGSEGLLALPFLQGERAPIYNPDARGVFFNIGMQHSRLHFARAILESICYELKWIAESVESVCGHSDKIVISGGIIHFSDWVQMLADVLNREVTVLSGHDASAMGAAHLGFQTMGLPFQFSNQIHAFYKPESSKALVYKDDYGRFLKLYTALQELF
ncbi:MAG TPA: gluconokinase [Cyclobacteriaceae bacterium]|nr:gluconokinase [Cyclobacteriaceae bacterium]